MDQQPPAGTAPRGCLRTCGGKLWGFHDLSYKGDNDVLAARQHNLIILAGDMYLSFLSYPRPFAFAKAGKAGKHEQRLMQAFEDMPQKRLMYVST